MSEIANKLMPYLKTPVTAIVLSLICLPHTFWRIGFAPICSERGAPSLVSSSLIICVLIVHRHIVHYHNAITMYLFNSWALKKNACFGSE